MTKKYRILAFIKHFKNRRRNSLIYSGESINELSIAIGVSQNSLRKYIAICEEKGLIRQHGKHKCFIKLVDAIDVLGLDRKNMKHVWFDGNTFMEIFKSIPEAIVMKNYLQQDFRRIENVELKKIAISVTKKDKPFYKELKKVKDEDHRKQLVKAYNKGVKKLIAMAQEWNSRKGTKKSTSAFCKSFSSKPNKPVCSGKNHVAKLTGMTPSTGRNILKRMHKSGKIIRAVIKKDTELKSNCHNMEKLQSRFRNVIPSKKTGTLWLSIGSEVSLDTEFVNTLKGGFKPVSRSKM